MASIKLKGDTSGEVTIQAPAVAGTTTLNLPATSSTLATQNALGVRNLIINGDMRIDQRNAGASVTPTSEVTLDRWYARENTDGAYTVQQVTDAPVGATNSLKLTVTTADASIASSQFSYIQQRIEGNNTAHLDWGTSDAKTVTLSFWVKSSLTGSFPVTLQNSAANRSYITTYTISSANTWEYKTVTIAGDTTGTWLTDNGIGIRVIFGIGTGSDRQGTADTWNAADAWETSSTVQILNTLNATWQISLVQLEVGDTATPFEHRPYDMELARCQRYYSTSIELGYTITDFPAFGAGRPGATFFCSVASGNDLFGNLQLPVAMRTAPTFNIYSAAHRTSGHVRDGATGANVSVANYSFSTGNNKSIVYMSGLSGTVSRPYNFHWTANAEL